MKVKHPGTILLREFLEPMDISLRELARHIGLSAPFVCDLVKGNRSISIRTAYLLAQALDTSPEYWMDLMHGYKLSKRGRIPIIGPIRI